MARRANLLVSRWQGEDEANGPKVRPEVHPRSVSKNIARTPFFGEGRNITTVLSQSRIASGALSDMDLLAEAAACYPAVEDMTAEMDDPFFAAPWSARLPYMVFRCFVSLQPELRHSATG